MLKRWPYAITTGVCRQIRHRIMRTANKNPVETKIAAADLTTRTLIIAHAECLE